MFRLKGGKISTLDKKYYTFHSIFDNPKNSNSFSSYLLLKNKYKEIDIDYKEHKYFIKLFQENPSDARKLLKQIVFDRNIKYYGELTCVICKNNNLVLPENIDNDCLPNNTATIEHTNPLSENGYKYATIFLECTCMKCNNDRGILPLVKIGKHSFIY